MKINITNKKHIIIISVIITVIIIIFCILYNKFNYLLYKYYYLNDKVIFIRKNFGVIQFEQLDNSANNTYMYLNYEKKINNLDIDEDMINDDDNDIDKKKRESFTMFCDKVKQIVNRVNEKMEKYNDEYTTIPI